MKWTPGGMSEDVEDRRDDDSGGGSSFGGFGGMHFGIGGTLLLLLLSFVFKTNLFSLFSSDGSATAPSSYEPRTSTRPREVNPNEQRSAQLVSFVLDDAQKTWEKILPEDGASYRHAKLVLFRNVTQSSCGTAETATGPFYCPGDEKVYIDLAFYDELARRFGAPGEFAQAYVIAHELGHHVQKILGIEGKVRQAQRRNPAAVNALSVRMELQADCFAGIWAHSTEQRNIIDTSDVDAGLKAAAAVGDDHLQKMSTGHVSPESFTHGTSAQRMQWFKAGLDGGKVTGCNTFAE